ncbi:ribosome hibernation-promoting factor, HPF/YfiA family [Ferrimonas balearica]|uniref:ribosome hibernation-promoting factor, HPF/YfiA family n=1 Tax=Ferrimonas balearica TaxID=44012 RepID=UPI001C59053E|nr:ribosome-associated translation inhibitor RaiA [Ferrimonas balearica]MBW3165255.1 ribosome-associated translation inhibitor RaiA [Ferrimonas balearica]MBY6018925.1 ribosome-associated translation inhibitor RaiA [Halomonas denitrificans]MBY6096115.1 ribosome-associated translation inhibitor RaiA [Ferrimonas balearica]
MRIEITSKPVSVTDSIRHRVHAKFEKLARHDVPLLNPHVMIDKEGQEYQVEATVAVPSGQLVATGQHQDMHVAINQMGQKLERQLVKLAAKETARRHDRTNQVAAEADEAIEAAEDAA